jgi:hypothetical protein
MPTKTKPDSALQQDLLLEEIPGPLKVATKTLTKRPLLDELRAFDEFGTKTTMLETVFTSQSGEVKIPTCVNEFWTAAQRAANNLHEVSYRACFKPQLPRFFIERLTKPGDVVYDPFMGRGTTLVEAALLGRIPFGCDVNPLSQTLVKPRLNPPTPEEIATRLSTIDFSVSHEIPDELLVFYHPGTLSEMVALKTYLQMRRDSGTYDSVDDFICMVALNRLTGHSPGFFSVYTLPPNQAVSIKSQTKINKDRSQIPPKRDVSAIILKKSRALLKECDAATRKNLSRIFKGSQLVTGMSSHTPSIKSNSVDLVVTSPPFLDVVDYAGDNWLRCWFMGIDVKQVSITMSKKIEDWESSMTQVFKELNRVLKPGGHVAFEVGEVRKGSIKLEVSVLKCGSAAGLFPQLVLINDQEFTKTANCWGVDNQSKGTNTNRIVLFRKD